MVDDVRVLLVAVKEANVTAIKHPICLFYLIFSTASDGITEAVHGGHLELALPELCKPVVVLAEARVSFW